MSDLLSQIMKQLQQQQQPQQQQMPNLQALGKPPDMFANPTPGGVLGNFKNTAGSTADMLKSLGAPQVSAGFTPTALDVGPAGMSTAGSLDALGGGSTAAAGGGDALAAMAAKI